MKDRDEDEKAQKGLGGKDETEKIAERLNQLRKTLKNPPAEEGEQEDSASPAPGN